MGLIQRLIEAVGIPTVSVSIKRDITEQVRPPRAVFLKWPLGHPLGEPGQVDQQTTVLLDVLELLVTATEPGVIRDLPYRWRREEYHLAARLEQFKLAAGAL
ncbi:MAG: hypothetical protein HY335_06445 [Deinococcus sp.]|nr:hypothetical protein [Deinococcus sp.]